MIQQIMVAQSKTKVLRSTSLMLVILTYTLAAGFTNQKEKSIAELPIRLSTKSAMIQVIHNI